MWKYLHPGFRQSSQMNLATAAQQFILKRLHGLPWSPPFHHVCVQVVSVSLTKKKPLFWQMSRRVEARPSLHLVLCLPLKVRSFSLLFLSSSQPPQPIRNNPGLTLSLSPRCSARWGRCWRCTATATSAWLSEARRGRSTRRASPRSPWRWTPTSWRQKTPANQEVRPLAGPGTRGTRPSACMPSSCTASPPPSIACAFATRLSLSALLVRQLLECFSPQHALHTACWQKELYADVAFRRCCRFPHLPLTLTLFSNMPMYNPHWMHLCFDRPSGQISLHWGDFWLITSDAAFNLSFYKPADSSFWTPSIPFPISHQAERRVTCLSRLFLRSGTVISVLEKLLSQSTEQDNPSRLVIEAAHGSASKVRELVQKYPDKVSAAFLPFYCSLLPLMAAQSPRTTTGRVGGDPLFSEYICAFMEYCSDHS